MDTLIQDLRFAARTLGRQQAWTAVAVITLALGIGANTAVFSVVNDLLLDPLRYPQSDRLVLISRVNATSGFQLTPTTKLRAAWSGARSFESLQGYRTDDLTLAGGMVPRIVHTAMIEPSFFAFAGARVVAGQAFRDDEATLAATPVAIVAEQFASETYGGVGSALGKTLRLDSRAYTIVGVVADGVRLPAFSTERAAVWLPLLPNTPFFSGPVIGRLRHGVTREVAERELRAITKEFARTDGSVNGTQFVIDVRAPGSTGQTRQSVLLLAGDLLPVGNRGRISGRHVGRAVVGRPFTV